MEQLECRRLLAADVRISEFMADNDSTLVDGNGASSDWIEIHNAGDQTADLSGWHLSDDPFLLDKWTFPAAPVPQLAPGAFLIVFASGSGAEDPNGNLHTNFSLNASRDTLHLSQPDGTVVSQFGDSEISYPPQRGDVSYGIDPAAAPDEERRYFLEPTPGSANSSGVIGFVGDTSFSVDRGFFDTAFTVDITSSTPNATIVYTIDGSQPSLGNGTQVTATNDLSPVASVLISSTTTLRAAAFLAEYQSTDVDTQSYLFLADVIQQPANPAGFPTDWGTAPSADYEMDPQITTDPSYASEMVDALRDLPSLSLVTEVNGLFGTDGIYSKPNNSNLEIPVSAEYILVDGETGFQIDAGLKIAGGASRNPGNSPKHSMSLRFREQYGDSKLDYPLFDGSPVSRFNSLQLRAMYNNSWIHWDNGQRSRGTLIRDQFIRDSLIAAGHDDAGWGNYAHLYLNGLYWGVYNIHERHDASHYAAHHGGDASDYDAVNGGAVIDGTIASFNQLKAVAEAGNWIDIQRLLDVDHFIDWSIAQAYGGNADLKTNGNWRGAGGGSADAPWRIYAWDSERVLEAVTAKAPETITDATGMLGDLLNVPEFVVRFGDRLQKHFFDDGAFTEQAAADRWNARVEELSSAIIAESARWGDYRRDVHPRGATPSLYQRDVHWDNEIARLRSTYFSGRPGFVIHGYEEMGVFPELGTPQTIINGSFDLEEIVEANSELRFLVDDGTAYYTFDGTDPRLESGAPNSSSLQYVPQVTETVVFAAGSNWKFDDVGIDLGTDWREPAYDDSSWAQGAGEFGYGDGDETTVVSFGGDTGNRHPTTYYRKTFSVVDNQFAAAKLRLRRDDGIIVHLNGREIFRNNVRSGDVAYGDFAIAAAADDGKDWLTVRLSPSMLTAGNHVLAVEIHQSSPTSSDTSFDAELIAETHAAAPVAIANSTEIRFRTRNDAGDWSAIKSVSLIVPQTPASSSNLRISEVHYNPAGDDDAEFIELVNITSGDEATEVDLASVQLIDGPSSPFVFAAGTTLASGQYGLLVRDRIAFQAAYPQVSSERILGEYDGKLDNGGERIRLLDALDQEIVDLQYGDNDPWPLWSDGFGGSLVLDDPVNTPADRLSKPYAWRGSVEIGGSPGAAAIRPSGVQINEILAHTDAPNKDAIELFNPTNSDIDLSHWYLSDDGDELAKFRVPDGTVLPAGGLIVFDEDDFNAAPLEPGNFALNSSTGDSVWLAEGNASGDILGLQASAGFGATFNGLSVGRLADGTDRLVPLANPSLGAVNGMFGISSIVISELNYHPADPTAAAIAIDPTLTDNDLEFIEIHNSGHTTVDLANWRLRGDADFDFPAGQQIDAAETLVVVDFDPADPLNSDRLDAFREQYSLDSNVSLFGPLSGSLGNGYGLVKLQRPDAPPLENPTLIPRITVDEVFYDDLTPWGESADGDGDSLNRRGRATLGTFYDSWVTDVPSPGQIAPGASVTEIKINGGDGGRSEVTSLEVRFDSEVELDEGAFEILDVATSTQVTGLDVTSKLEGGKTVATIKFTSGDSIVAPDHESILATLANGNYRLTVRSGGVRLSGTGYLMQEDATESFFRSYGDADGDGSVGLLDFAEFRRSFGRAVGEPTFQSQLDSDRDGVITLVDFAAFRREFG